MSCGKEGSGHWLPADPGTGDTELGNEGKRRLLSAPPGAVQECAGYSLQQYFSITIFTPLC